MTATEPVRWGILGLANIIRRFAPALAVAGNADLVAVATTRPAAAEPLRATWPDVSVYDDYAALLADQSVDVVYIPLPNTLHADWTVRALVAGKHVLCEKPLATTLAEVEAVADAARRANRLVMEGFMWRFHPQHARVQQVMADGAIGEPTLVRASLSFTIDRSRQNIRLDPALGGGTIWDVGCYAISIPRFLFQAEPHSISATARIDQATGVDMSLAALATFPGERVAVLDASMERTRRTMYEVIGDRGSLAIDQFWAEPDAPARITRTDRDGVHSIEMVAPANHFVGEIEHFSAAVRGQTPLRYGIDDALAQIRALEAMQRAFSSNRAEPVESSSA